MDSSCCLSCDSRLLVVTPPSVGSSFAARLYELYTGAAGLPARDLSVFAPGFTPIPRQRSVRAYGLPTRSVQ